MKKTLKILFYIALVFAVLFGIGVLIMSSYKGNSPEWKAQVEDIASELTGKNVSIGELQYAQLFPELSFDANYIFAADPPPIDPEEDIQRGESFVVSKMQFAVPFWSIFWGKPVVRHLLIEGAAIIGVDNFAIQKIYIETPENDIPKLRINGIYENESFDIWVELDKYGKGYTPVKDSKFDANFADLKISGVITSNDEALSLKPLDYKADGHDLSGQLDMFFDRSFYLLLNKNNEQYIEAKSVIEDIPATSTPVEISSLSDTLLQNILLNFCQVSAAQYIEFTAVTYQKSIAECYEEPAEENNVSPIQIDEQNQETSEVAPIEEERAVNTPTEAENNDAANP